MFLLGGGFAISKGSIASGLAHRIGNALLPLRVLPPAIILLLISMFVGTFTELTSNVGIANIALPVIAQMVGNRVSAGETAHLFFNQINPSQTSSTLKPTENSKWPVLDFFFLKLFKRFLRKFLKKLICE